MKLENFWRKLPLANALANIEIADFRNAIDEMIWGTKLRKYVLDILESPECLENHEVQNNSLTAMLSALRLYPEAKVLEITGNNDRALDLYQRALETYARYKEGEWQPYVAECHFGIASIYHVQGNNDGAIEHFEKIHSDHVLYTEAQDRLQSMTR